VVLSRSTHADTALALGCTFSRSTSKCLAMCWASCAEFDLDQCALHLWSRFSQSAIDRNRALSRYSTIAPLKRGHRTRRSLDGACGIRHFQVAKKRVSCKDDCLSPVEAPGPTLAMANAGSAVWKQ
jgi:hypothetical protein